MNNILIVDDDIHIGNVLEEILTKEGYATTRAYSGTEAQLLLAKQRPDLILLDLMLPGLDGEELLPQIKELLARIQVHLREAQGRRKPEKPH